MKIAFTGTRKGMSSAQREQFSKVLLWFAGPPREPKIEGFTFHDGWALGADQEAAELALLYFPRSCIHIHPAPGHEPLPARARELYVLYEVFPPLERNRHMVDACDVLIAAPETDREVLRSGTWATVRYARSQGRPVVMLSRGES